MGSRFLNLCSAFQFFFDVLMDSNKQAIRQKKKLLKSVRLRHVIAFLASVA
jgi:hypothetical protein